MRKQSIKLTVVSLIAAARKGNLAKIRECLSEGLNVNAVAGGVALNCPLGGAAEKGRVEALQLLLAAGANPNNPLLPKHAIFPLDWAAFGGHMDCVRALLEAGADVNRIRWDDKTVLDWVDLPGASDNYPMVALLKKHGAKTAGQIGKPASKKFVEPETENEEDSRMVNLSREANRPEFSKLVAKLTKESGIAAEGSQNVRGGYSFPVSREVAEKILEGHFDKAREAGFYLFRATSSDSNESHTLMLLPTSDVGVVVRAMRTNGANYDLTPSDIVKWLRAFQKKQPLVLDGIGHDFLEGRFTSEPKDFNALAKEIYKFCPDVVDQGAETVQRLAAELKRTKRVFLWWD